MKNQEFKVEQIDNSAYESGTVENTNLYVEEAGNYKFRIAKVAMSNSFEGDDEDGMKKGLKEQILAGEYWCKPVHQYKLTLVETKESGNRTMIIRLALINPDPKFDSGYWNKNDEEYTPEKFNNFKGSQYKILKHGYIGELVKSGDHKGLYARIPEAGKSAKARRLTNECLTALGFGPESPNANNPKAMFEQARDEKLEMIVEVKMETHEGKDYPKAKRYFKVGDTEKHLHESTAEKSRFGGFLG